ncbi:hypothetical protein JCM11641_000305 [Rhodosporidiobolus odoratus]
MAVTGRSGGIGPSRTAFTQRDKDNLAEYLSTFARDDRSKPSTYKEAGAALPGHPWAGWHEHYKKQKTDIDMRIARVIRGRKRAAEAGQDEDGFDEVDELDSSSDADSDQLLIKKRAKGKGRARDSSSPEEEVRRARKRTRTEFHDGTDIPRLISMFVKKEGMAGDGWTKKRCYDELETKYGDHAASSWQSYYSKNKEQVDSLVLAEFNRRKQKKYGRQRSVNEMLFADSKPKTKTEMKSRNSTDEASVVAPNESPQASTSANAVASTSKAKPPAASTSKALSSNSPAKSRIERRASSSTGKGKGKAVVETDESEEEAEAVNPSRKKRSRGDEENDEKEDDEAGDGLLPLAPSGKTKGKAPERVQNTSQGEGKGKGRGVVIDLLGSGSSDDDEEEEEEEEEQEEREVWTTEDDDMLVYWLAKGEINDWQRDNVYKHLAQKHPHHSAEAWRSRYNFDKRTYIRRVGEKVAEVEDSRARKREEVKKRKEHQDREEKERLKEEQARRAREQSEREEQTRQDRAQRERVEQERAGKKKAEQASAAVATAAAAAAAAPSPHRRQRFLPGLEPPTPPPPSAVPTGLPPTASRKSSAAPTVLTPRSTPPPSTSASRSVVTEESQAGPFTQALPATGQGQQVANQEDEENEEYGGGMDADDSHFYDQSDFARAAEDEAEEESQSLYTQAILPQAALTHGQHHDRVVDAPMVPLHPPPATQDSTSSLPRHSQYSEKPSPFLSGASRREAEQQRRVGAQEEDEDERDQREDDQASQETDEDDRMMEVQLRGEVARPVVGGDAAVKAEPTEAQYAAALGAEHAMTRSDDDWISSDEEEDDDDDDPSRPLWNPLTDPQAEFIQQLFRLNDRLRQDEERGQSEAEIVKIEATPAPQLQPAPSTARTAPPPPPPVVSQRRTPSPPMPSPGRKKRTHSERCQTDNDGRFQEVDDSQQQQPARKRQRLMSVERDEATPAPSVATDLEEHSEDVLQLVGRNAPITRSKVDTGKGKEREIEPSPLPTPPPAQGAPVSSSRVPSILPTSAAGASAAGSPARTEAGSSANLAPPIQHFKFKVKPPVPLHTRITNLAAQYDLPFSTVRDLHFCATIISDFRIFGNLLLLFSPHAPEEGTAERKRLERLAERLLWSYEEDVCLLTGSEEERQELERRKGPEVEKRRVFFTRARLTGVERLKRGMYECLVRR